MTTWLDARQRAMLAEMGVPLWAPPAVAPAPAPVPVSARATHHPAVASDASGLVSRPSVQPPQGGPDRVSPRAAAPVSATPHKPAPRSVVPVVVAESLPPGCDDRAGLDEAIRACQRCDLGQRRQQAVPGMGDPAGDWLIVGEAPGEEEDRQGLPFVGRAGQLLDKMLAAMGLSREQKVYIANVIKCRPPHNRNPDPVEIAQCAPYLLRQVALQQPKIILAMGRFAAQTVLAEGGCFTADALRQMPLGKLRGQVHEVTLAGQRLPVVVTYHPAYLLRSPGEKAKAWADLCLALDTWQPQR